MEGKEGGDTNPRTKNYILLILNSLTAKMFGAGSFMRGESMQFVENIELASRSKRCFSRFRPRIAPKFLANVRLALNGARHSILGAGVDLPHLWLSRESPGLLNYFSDSWVIPRWDNRRDVKESYFEVCDS
jgi:hypothetical protein